MKKVAFVCVHDSCRSQIAEALGRALASDVFESYSAGTETKPQINADAMRLFAFCGAGCLFLSRCVENARRPIRSAITSFPCITQTSIIAGLCKHIILNLQASCGLPVFCAKI